MWASFSNIIKKEFVKFYQNILYDNKLIANDNYEYIDLTNTQITVTENFAYRGEDYPVVVVSAEGGQLLVRGFNDDVSTHHVEQTLGSVATDYGNIGKHAGGHAKLAVKFTPSEDFGLEQVELKIDNSGTYSQGDITVSIYGGGDDPEDGSLVASGSIEGFTKTGVINNKYVGFGSDIDLVTTEHYWIVLDAEENSGYYGYIDTTSVSEDYTVAIQDDTGDDWVLSENMGLVCKLTGDTQTVLGGDVKVPIVVQIAANDAGTVDDIFDIVLLFTELAKRYEYSDFSDNRIKIESISFGGDTAPREVGGGNIQIFVKQMTINVVGAWTYSVDAELLNEFGYNITTYTKQ